MLQAEKSLMELYISKNVIFFQTVNICMNPTL